MKKVISVIIALTVMLQTSVCFCAGAKTYSFENNDFALSFIKKLGIVSEDYETENMMTRAEFVGLALDIMKIVPTDTGKRFFIDVDEKYWAYKAISTAADCGYVSGNGAGAFNPDDAISTTDAVTVSMRMLNYGYLKGTSDYNSVISDNMLNKNVKADENGRLTRASALQLLYNTMLATYNEFYSIDKGIPKYKPDADTTIASKVWDINRVSTKVTANRYTGIEGEGAVGSDGIILNGEKINDPEGMGQHMLGYYVTAFVKKTSNDEYDLMFIFTDEKKNSEIVIDAEDLLPENENYNVKNIVYLNEDGRRKQAKLDDNFELIYNGEKYDGFTAADYDIASGQMRLLDNDKDGIYDVIFIDRFVNYQIANISENEKLIYAKKPGSNVMETIDYSGKRAENIVILSSDGKRAEIDALSKNAVISLYESKSGNLLKIAMGKGKLKLTPSKVDAEEYIVESGKEKYEVSRLFTQFFNLVEHGTAVMCYFDVMGRIAAVGTENMRGYNYGYLINITENDEDKVTIKLLNEDNEIKWYEVAQKAELNDVKSKNSVLTAKFHTGGILKRQLIRYELNNVGEIRKLWTYEDKSTSVNYDDYTTKNFTLDYITKDNSCYRGGSLKTLDSKFIINESTIKFVVPDNEQADESQYECTTCGGMTDREGGFKYELFDVSEDYITSVLIERSESANSFSNSQYEPYVIIKKVRLGLNGDDMPAVLIDGYLNGKEVSYCSNGERIADSGSWAPAFAGITVDELKPGDIVQFRQDLRDEICGMRILVRSSNLGAYDERNVAGSTVKATTMYAAMYTTVAVAEKQLDKSVLLYSNHLHTGETKNIRTVPLLSTIKYYVYNSDEKRLEPATKNEYMQGRYVFMALKYNDIETIVIYK